MATNKNTPPNVVGEPFKEYVNSQIRVRQQAHGSGFKSTRSDKDLVYLNSRNAWVKVASSVDVIPEDGITKLKELGLDPNLTRDQLSKKAILFNGTSEFGNKTQPGGVASNNSIFNNSAYGFGGSSFGLQPMPGITSFTIGHNNIGSIRTATINIRAHSPLQFGIINLLYIRLGFSILVEWGNSMYLDNDGKLQKMGPTLIDEVWFKGGITPLEFTDLTEEKKEQYHGNYDGFFGKVVNFNYKFNTDGSYDIELKLISQGDVIESFRLDAVTPEYLLANPDGGEWNINNILNRLYCLKEKKGNKNAQDYIDAGLIDQFPPELGDIVNPVQIDYGVISYFDDVEFDRLYLRFGYVLKLIKSFIPLNQTQDKEYPQLEFNISKANYSKNSPFLVSFDPDVCFINNGFKINPKKEGSDIFKQFLPYKTDNTSLGTILNIYIETDFFVKTIKNILNTENKLTVFNLLKALCDGINRSLAGVTALYPSLQDDYMVVIRDANLDVRTGEDGKKIPDEIHSETIELFGYNTSTDTPQSNFIKDFDFTTTISKELSSMMSIGATAGNTDISEYSDFFKNLNKGLEDRYKTGNTIGEKSFNFREGCKRKESKQTRDTSKTTTVGNTFNAVPTYNTYRPTKAKPEEDLSKLTRSEKFEKILKDWSSWRGKALDLTNQDLTGDKFIKYFLPKESGEVNWNQGKSIFKSLMKVFQNPKTNNPTNSSNIGFIPMGVNLTLDGIGGMKIFNQLKLNTLHLPVGYPDEVELVVVGLDHQIQNNSWITKVRTLTKPKSVLEESVELIETLPPGTKKITKEDETGLESISSVDLTLDQLEDPRRGENYDPASLINPRRIGTLGYDHSPTARYLKNNLIQSNGGLGKRTLEVIQKGGNITYPEYYDALTKTYDFYLAKTAARAFKNWMKDCRKKGIPSDQLEISSAYRTLKHQQDISAATVEPLRAAPAGRSAHGWGGAVDFKKLSLPTTGLLENRNGRVNNRYYKLIAATGAKWGWYNPWRLSDYDGNVDEMWHFEYWGPTIFQTNAFKKAGNIRLDNLLNL